MKKSPESSEIFPVLLLHSQSLFIYSKEDIRSEAVKALTFTPPSEKQLFELKTGADNRTKQMPPFPELIRYIKDKVRHVISFPPKTRTESDGPFPFLSGSPT